MYLFQNMFFMVNTIHDTKLGDVHTQINYMNMYKMGSTVTAKILLSGKEPAF